jgi:hypothetical protein
VIPLPLPYLRLALAAVALSAAAAAGWTLEHWRLGAKVARMERDAEQAARQASETARENERLGRMARDRSLDDAHRRLTTAHAAARSADDVAGQLRQHIAQLAAEYQAGGRPAPLGSGVAAGPAVLVHADVLGWLATYGREAAAAAQAAHDAAIQCGIEYGIARGIGRGEMKP